jgi:hypothetical protein
MKGPLTPSPGRDLRIATSVATVRCTLVIPAYDEDQSISGCRDALAEAPFHWVQCSQSGWCSTTGRPTGRSKW